MHKTYTIMFWVSIVLVVASIAMIFVFGLKFGVDFKGGSVIELNFKNSRPDIEAINTALADKDFLISPSGTNGLIIRTRELTESSHQAILGKLSSAFSSAGPEEKKFDSVGPVIGNELKSKSANAIILVLVAIMVYIAIVFRKLSRFLSPWSLGGAAIIALMHDIVIPAGVFAWLGHAHGVEISAVFVAAVLTILGFSVSDTVVVFDRVRENLIKGGAKEGLGAVVHKSIMQTLTRSLNTTMTTILSLVAIYFFGGESIKYFALALIMGFFFGAYSSIFVASPLLVWWNTRTR
jgi:preprotein translocase subunit SecF